MSRCVSCARHKARIVELEADLLRALRSCTSEERVFFHTYRIWRHEAEATMRQLEHAKEGKK